jgi:neutral trehalase
MSKQHDEHKTREEELQEKIFKVRKHIRYIKTQHCDGCEPHEMCNTCKENFRELRIPLNKLKAELKGIKQGYAKAMNDVEKIIDFQMMVKEKWISEGQAKALKQSLAELGKENK